MDFRYFLWPDLERSRKSIPYEQGNFRSFVFPMDDITIIGVENDVTGGDLDCN